MESDTVPPLSGSAVGPAMTHNQDDTSAQSPGPSNEDGGDYCRICRGEASPEQPLFYPCKCSGSIKYVHQDCLMEWLSHSQKKYCELCKTPFRFTKLYDQSMPSTLPFPLFLRQVVLHAVIASARWARYIIVGCIWIFCLPWSIRQIWRGLFWLADGSWISEDDLLQAALHAGSQGLDNRTSSVVMENLGSISANTSADEVLDHFVPPLLEALGSLLRLLSGESLISKVVRFVFTIPKLQYGDLLSSNSTNGTGQTHVAQRPASLLSEVHFIQSLSSQPAVNNALVDVFEGQLICIVLIAAFILVFLIREWVINQQPMLNMPDPEIAENPAGQVQLNNDGPQAVRRRRRIARRARDRLENAGEANRDLVDRPMAAPRARRALTDDNVVARRARTPDEAGLVQEASSLDRPGAAPRSASLVLGQDLGAQRQDEHDIFERAIMAEPPPLTRGALGFAVDVQRNIEESANRVGQLNGIHHETTQAATNRPDTAFDLAEEQTWPSESDVFAEPEDTKELPGTDVLEADTSNVDHSLPFGDEIMLGDVQDEIEVPDTESDEVVIATPGSTDSSHAAEVDAIAHDNEEMLPEPEQPVADTARGDASFFETIAAWLWQTDGYVPDPTMATGQDDERIIGDVHAEAPFVPILHREALGAPVQPAPPIEPVVREPNIQFGIDFNDPNAIDDAEELEGILELIGMEGPITGMIQNVIFSLFLITLTLTASVWIPYIWGKIALLFMANPVIVFIKAPLFVVSKGADIIADMVFFVLGMCGFLANHVTKVVKVMTKSVFPPFSNFLDTDLLEELALGLCHSSGHRLEKAMTGTFFGLRPDLPTFSMQSHHALRAFKGAFGNVSSIASSSLQNINGLWNYEPWTMGMVSATMTAAVKSAPHVPKTTWKLFQNISAVANDLSSSLHSVSFNDPETVDYSLVEWSTQDKIIVIMMGYGFFALAGLAFLKVAHLFLGLRRDEKVEGSVADTLRQAGGVMKVIIIIGIEMIVFPLYCGLLLDFALLPLFAEGSVQTRLQFMIQAPCTGMFIHWFIGTCYMFHFALFVSMCRRIMRKGVLYFIRDPDDPTFHPVRDVLERPVPTQLGKIAFSALVYGGLVIFCLGGVVWALSSIGGILPIHWATNEPRLAFPADVIFYNFLLPFIVRKAEPSKKIALIYEWWFRGCASGLRLTHFLFGEEREDEKYTRPRFHWLHPNSDSATEAEHHRDGTYVRAPAADSVRIPKNQKVFLEVSENNERLDGEKDREQGMHGKTDERFSKVYIPPQFRARIATFIFLLWVFAAATGMAFTIGPLLIGRKVVKLLAGSNLPPNDLYALTVGVHICGILGYAIAYSRPAKQWLQERSGHWMTNTREFLPQLWTACKHVLGLIYLASFFGVVLPFTMSLATELYIHVPLYTFLSQPNTGDSNPRISQTADKQRSPTIFVLQTWTLGLLYIRLALRLALNYPNRDTRLSVALRAIVRNGYLHPDVRLASRAVILPCTILCLVLLGAPLGYAKAVVSIGKITDHEAKRHVFRFAYPVLLGAVMTLTALMVLKSQVRSWRVRIRDEVYLIGERLHNYQDTKVKGKKERPSGEKDKRKEKEVTT